MVWDHLTQPLLMNSWMSEERLEIITDWNVGTAITIGLELHGIKVQSSGTVLACEPQHLLRYTHLSSLSELPDIQENYAVLQFLLEAAPEGTRLEVSISNFATEAIYRHMLFYWNTALELLKKKIEEPVS